jgi:hypothetical protein
VSRFGAEERRVRGRSQDIWTAGGQDEVAEEVKYYRPRRGRRELRAFQNRELRPVVHTHTSRKIICRVRELRSATVIFRKAVCVPLLSSFYSPLGFSSWESSRFATVSDPWLGSSFLDSPVAHRLGQRGRKAARAAP